MAITVGVMSVAVGIGIPVFYENQIESAVSISFFLQRVWLSLFKISTEIAQNLASFLAIS